MCRVVFFQERNRITAGKKRKSVSNYASSVSNKDSSVSLPEADFFSLSCMGQREFSSDFLCFPSLFSLMEGREILHESLIGNRSDPLHFHCHFTLHFYCMLVPGDMRISQPLRSVHAASFSFLLRP